LQIPVCKQLKKEPQGSFFMPVFRAA